MWIRAQLTEFSQSWLDFSHEIPQYGHIETVKRKIGLHSLRQAHNRTEVYDRVEDREAFLLEKALDFFAHCGQV